MVDANILDEAAADLAVTDVLRSHGKISASQIIYKGEIRMALLAKDENGNVIEVLESRPVTLEHLNAKIKEWTDRRDEFLALTGQSADQAPAPTPAPADPATPVVAAPVVDPSVSAPVAPAQTDQVVPQAPVAPAAPQQVDQAQPQVQQPVFPQ